MAVSGVTSGLGSATSSSSKSKAAETADLSPVQKVLAKKKADDAKKSNFLESQTYLSAKANQLKYMMAVYGNLGLTEEYKAVEAESKKLIQKYYKLYGAPKSASSNSTTSTTA